MDQFFGVIEILEVDNISPKEFEIHGAENLMLLDHIRFVHYSDSQQLILLLPKYFREYTNVIIHNLEDNIIIFNHKVSDIICGSIQILVDTLFIYPGTYELTINKNNGMTHIVQFKKYHEGQVPKLKEIVEISDNENFKKPIAYSDGFGSIISNEELLLRESILDKIFNKFTRRLEYISQGKEGEVIYIEGEKRIKFYMETGAYECLFYLNIPSAEEWEKTTNFPLTEREEILTFVAEQTQRDQASSCVYKILDGEISYYSKKIK